MEDADPTIAEHLGDTYRAHGRQDKAVEHWTQSFLVDPGNDAVGGKLSEAGVDLDALRRQAEESRND